MFVRTVTSRPRSVSGAFAAIVLVGALVPSAAPAPAVEAVTPLPLGRSGLVEKRTETVLADGVTLTRIVRGTGKAKPKKFAKTSKGPWVVNVVEIDPAVADGQLVATYGADLGRVERTTSLVAQAGGLVGVNGSFFAFTRDKKFPGNPVGVGVYGGELLSEPTGRISEVAVVLDAASGVLRFGPLRWGGTLRNSVTGAFLTLTAVNNPPKVPAGCRRDDAPGQCQSPGKIVLFDPEFAARTPSGHGVEAVLDDAGCPVIVREKRGYRLTPGQTSVQATGLAADAVRELATAGCIRTEVSLADRLGLPVTLTPDTYAVNGRYVLVANGLNTAPAGKKGFLARNARTVIGTTPQGRILLVTINGKQRKSVGTTLRETAAVAIALGMTDAVNLDGGGSATMARSGALISKPSGKRERSVGDALVFVPSPAPPPVLLPTTPPSRPPATDDGTGAPPSP